MVVRCSSAETVAEELEGSRWGWHYQHEHVEVAQEASIGGDTEQDDVEESEAAGGEGQEGDEVEADADMSEAGDDGLSSDMTGTIEHRPLIAQRPAGGPGSPTATPHPPQPRRVQDPCQQRSWPRLEALCHRLQEHNANSKPLSLL